jgi:predicted transcriptional regulator
MKGNSKHGAATRVLTAHVPLPLAEKVDQLAARLDRSRGWIIKQALAAWVDEHERIEQLLQQSPAELTVRPLPDRTDT